MAAPLTTVSGKFASETVEAIAKAAVQSLALDQGLSESEVYDLNFQVNMQYVINHDATEVRIAWGLRRWDSRRVMSLHFTRDATREVDNQDFVEKVLLPSIAGINFKSEYYGCMLPETLRKRVKQVVLVKNSVMVLFENSRGVSTPRETYPSKDFLAACGLVYDLPGVAYPEIIHV